jgi:hypothetical protein
VLAIEIVLGALDRDSRVITQQRWELVLMLGVLAVNIAIAIWKNR